MGSSKLFSRFPKAISTERRVTADPVSAGVFESLESRQFLSASPVVNPGGPINPPASVVMPGNSVKTFGVTIHVKAGQAFNGYLGVLIGAKNVASDFRNLRAAIDWGDGSPQPSFGVFTAGAKPGHIDVSGQHTYATDGTFSINIFVTEGPILKPGQPNPFFFIHLADIHSQAIVSEPANLSGGVTIHETEGAAFTTPVGSFNAIAPADGLAATIKWGDGATSTGKLVAVEGFAVDVIKFNGVGTHTYHGEGKFPIHIVVTRSIFPGMTQVIANIDSAALVVDAPV